jgi:hypothetical protein
MKHFIKENGYNPSIAFILFFALMNVIFCLIPFVFFYEAFVEPHYWKNRWRLHRLLNRGLVKVKYNRVSSVFGDNIKTYDLTIEDEEYSLWIWNGDSFTLDGPMDSSYGVTDRNYIGLFKGSLITRLLNRVAIKKLTQLAEHSAYEDYEEMSTNCSIKNLNC